MSIRKTALFILFIFLINFIWEILQMKFFIDVTHGTKEFLLMHIQASIGDVILFFLIYTIGITVFRNGLWMHHGKYAFLFVVMIGSVLAIIIEQYALRTGRWHYNELMPIIPIVHVGLFPILQLIILPAITLFLFRKACSDAS